MTPPDVLVLGAGFTGATVLRLARERGMTGLGTARSQASAAPLLAEGLSIVIAPVLAHGIAAYVSEHTHVVVAFPPDGHTDAVVAPQLSAAKSIAYVSSTGVYGALRGRLDSSTPLPAAPDERARRILDAETCYRAVGATVLRCPGIYGSERGLHVRVLRGEHRIPGDGTRTLSRIHVYDLAQCLLAATAARGETLVIGDAAPAPHVEVVQFVCERYGVALPESVPLESVHPSLRADRQVDAAAALARLGVRLRFPSYRDGMAPDATRPS